MFDAAKAEKVLESFPVLSIALQSGVVSMKMVRELMDVDRWIMQDIYKELVLAGAVVGVSSSTFKASPAMLKYLREKRAKEGVVENE